MTDVLTSVLGDNLAHLDVTVARVDGRWLVRVADPGSGPSLLPQPDHETVLADVSEVIASLLKVSLP